MPLEARPLFRPDVVRSRMRGYTPPLRVSNGRERLKRWADLLSTDRGEHLKEQELLPDFLTEENQGE